VAENLASDREDGIVRFAWEDLPALGVLLEAAPGLCRADYIAWQYERNPCLAPGQMPLFVRFREGRIEGQAGARVVRLKNGPWEETAHWITNLFVDPGSQRRGVGAALERVCVAETGIALALDVTPPAERLLRRHGACDLGLVPFYVRPLDVEAFCAKRPMPAIVAPIVSRMVRLLDRRCARVLRKNPVELVPVDRFSVAADEVWESCAPHYPVLVRRDRVYLNWRFASDPLHRYELFEVRREGRAIGSAVLRAGEWGAMPAGFVVDWLCAPRDGEALLAACLEVFRARRLAAAYCVHRNPTGTGMLFRIGFVPRPGGFRFLLRGEAGGAFLRDARSWYVTMGDSNVDRPREQARVRIRE